jgi:sRNA-binding regulator protein Hfq
MKNGKKRDRGGVVEDQQEQERLGCLSVDWHEQYEVIRRLNHETERDLHDILELKKKSDVTFEQKIKLLEQKLSLTNDTIQSFEGQKKMKLQHNDENEIQRLRKEIEIYQLLTGVKLKGEGDGRYLCTLENENTKKHVQFAIISTSNTEEDIEYEPITNSELLPEYLQSNLAFERALGPIMLGDAITSLFPPEE